MDLASMKRWDLQALCKRHGLAGGGTNADLVARLAGALTGSGGAEEQAVEVVAGKGCLKRPAGGSSSGGSGAGKKVTFVFEEEDGPEVEAEARTRGRHAKSQVMRSPVVAKTKGTQKVGETLPGADLGGAERRRTRAQAAGDSADESDAGEAGTNAPVRRSRRNVVNLDAGNEVEMVTGVVTRNNSGKAVEEEEKVEEAVDRKRKRKTREHDEGADVSGQVGVSRRSTRSSVHSGLTSVSSPPGEKKRGRRKSGDLTEQTSVEEQPSEVQHSGRTLRSGLVVVSPVSPIVSESRRRKLQEEEPAVKAAKLEISGRTTRSTSVAAAVTSPIVVEKKRRRKTEDLHLDREPPTVPIIAAPVTRVLRSRAVQVSDSAVEETHFDKQLESKRQPSRPSTRNRRLQHVASSAEEGSQEQVALPCVASPLRRSGRNHSEGDKLSNNNTTLLEQGAKGKRGNTRGQDLQNVKAGDVENQPTVKEPVKRSTRQSLVPAMLEKKSKDLSTEVTRESQVTRSTRKSVIPAMLEKERKGLTKEVIPEAHIRQSTQKSAVRAIPAGMDPDARVIVRRSMQKSVLPGMLNNEHKDYGKKPITEIGGMEKQLGVEEPVRRLTRKSVVPAVLEKGNKGLHTEMKSEAPVKRSVRKSVAPNAVDKTNNACSEIVRMQESGVRTRNSHTRLQFAVQNDEGQQRTTRKSSKLVVPQLQSKSAASKGRPAKRTKTTVLHMPLEEPNADDMVVRGATQDGEKVTQEIGHIQEIRQVSATVEEFPSAPLLGTLLEDTNRIPSVNEEIHESDSGLAKSSHEEDQVTSGQLVFLEAANCFEKTNSDEVACKDEENTKPLNYINSSCEQSDANRPGEHVCSITDNDELHHGSDLSRLEATDILDEQIECSNTEAPQQGLKEQGLKEQREVLHVPVEEPNADGAVIREAMQDGDEVTHEKGLKEQREVLHMPVEDPNADGTVIREAVQDGDEVTHEQSLKEQCEVLHMPVEEPNIDGMVIKEALQDVNEVTHELDLKEQCEVMHMPVEEPNTDGTVIREAIQAGDEVTHGYTEVSSSCTLEIRQVNIIEEESPSAPFLGTLLEDPQKVQIMNEEIHESEPGSTKSTHEDQVASEQLVFLEAANCIEKTNSEDVACKDEENKKPVDYINSSCEPTDANRPGCSSTEVPQQDIKELCEVQKEEQVAYGAHSDLVEAATVKDLQSGVLPIPANEKSNLQDARPNSELEGAELVESGLSCEKGISNILEFGSSVNHVVEIVPSDSSLPEDSSLDHYQQNKLLNGLSVEESRQESPMHLEDSDLVAGGTTEKPPFHLAIPNYNIDGLSKEFVHSTKNYAERCLLKSQALTHYAIFSAEKSFSMASGIPEAAPIEGSESAKAVLSYVETSAFPDEQPNAELGDDEFKENNLSCGEDNVDILGAESVNNEVTDLAEGCLLDSCQEQEKFPNDQSARKSPEESAICQVECVVGSGIGQTIEGRFTDETSTKDHKEEHSGYIEDQVTTGILANSMSEPSLFGGSESVMLPTTETLPLPDEFNTTLEVNEQHSPVCDKDNNYISDTGPVGNNNISTLKDDFCHDMPASKSPEGSAICLLPSAETSALPDEKFNTMLEVNEEHSPICDEDNDYISDTGLQGNNNLSNLKDDSCHDMPAPKSPEESAIRLLPTAETSPLPDEKSNTMLEVNEEHSPICDEDNDYISDTGPVGNNDLSTLKDSFCHDMPAPKSPEESAIHLDDSILASEGICRTSGRRRVDEISTKLLSFKISSAVKGSYIAMDAPCCATQGAIPFLGNSTDTSAAETDLPKSNTDHLVTNVELAVDNPDNRLGVEQVHQDDVQEGILEKTSLGSATPVCKHECGLLDKAVLHSMRNDRCSSSVEQSPFGLQSLFLQENIEPMECGSSDVGLAAENSGNKLAMELLQQDDVQVQEGTREKAPLGSAEPDCKHESRVHEELELQSMKNERCSSTVEQSPFVLQSLFSQENIEEPIEYEAPALARGQGENEVGGSKDEYRVEKTPSPEPIEYEAPDLARGQGENEVGGSEDEGRVEKTPSPEPIEYEAPDLARGQGENEVGGSEDEGRVEKTPSPEPFEYEDPDLARVQGENEAGGSEDEYRVEKTPSPEPVEYEASDLVRVEGENEVGGSKDEYEVEKTPSPEPVEYEAPDLARVQDENEAGGSKEQYRVEKTPSPESVSDHETSKDGDCVYPCEQDSEKEGLTEPSHEQEQAASGQLEFLDTVNHTKKDANSEEVSAIDDDLLNSALDAPSMDSDQMLPSDNLYELDSFDFMSVDYLTDHSDDDKED